MRLANPAGKELANSRFAQNCWRLAVAFVGLLAVLMLSAEPRARQQAADEAPAGTAQDGSVDVMRFQMFGVRLGLPLPLAKQALVSEGFFCVDFARVPGFDQLVRSRASGRRSQSGGDAASNELEGTSCQSRNQGRMVIRGTMAPGGAHVVSSIVRSLDRETGDEREFDRQVEELFGSPTVPEYPFPARWCSRLMPGGNGCDMREPWMERRKLAVSLNLGTRHDAEMRALLARSRRSGNR